MRPTSFSDPLPRHGLPLSRRLCRAFAGLLLAVFCALVASPRAQAQWVRESYPLKAGWNAIWLSQDCSDRTIAALVAGYPQIEEIWRWNPLASATQFIQAPSTPINPDRSWAVWRKTDVATTTLGSLTGNSAYLVKVADGAPTFVFQLLGKPLAPAYVFSSSGLNFLGFPATATPGISDVLNFSTPSFETFLSFSEALKTIPQVSQPQIYYYVGGALSEVFPKNPLLLTNPRFATVARGRAYWVKSHVFADFYGPLKVSTVGDRGLEFGSKLNTTTVRIKNVTDPAKGQSVIATLALAASEPAPGQGAAAPPVPLRRRGPRDANLQFTYTALPAAITLAPGEEQELVLDANRAQLTSAGVSYESILRITDSLGHTRIDLPVSAIGTSRAGVWVGAAVLNAVNRVETVTGPEFDAPIGTPNGTGPETVSTVVTTSTTTGGQTASTQDFDADFDADGKIYLGAAGIAPADVSVAALATTTIADPGFNPGANDTVFAVAAQPDGKVVAGGFFSTLGGQSRSIIGRLNADGTLDTGFSASVTGSFVWALAIQPDGKILVGGRFTSVNGQARSNLARLNADGTLDAGFNPGADGTIVQCFALQPDGKILVGGDFATLGGQARARFGRLNADGTLDTSFADPAITGGSGNGVFAIQIQPDGKVLIGGWFSTVQGQSRLSLARLDADGTLDAGFIPDATAYVYSLLLQEDGKVLVGGYLTNLGPVWYEQPIRNGLGRIHADGTLDLSFDPNVQYNSSLGTVYSLLAQSDGKIIIGGNFNKIGGQPRSNIGRIYSDGTLDLSFDPGVSNSGYLQALAWQDSSNVIVGGYFTTLGGQPRANIGRLKLPPSLFPPAVQGAGNDYTITSSTRAIVTAGGSGYTSAPAVTLTGGGGSGATATAQLSGGVRSVTITNPGNYDYAPEVNFSGGGGSGAAAIAVVKDNLITDVVITNIGSGYTSAPNVTFSGGDGTGGAATAAFGGSVGTVIITNGGSGYTAPPTVAFTGGGGTGAAASVVLAPSGSVTGVDVVQKESGGSLDAAASARVTVITRVAAPAGTPDGTTTSTVTSTSQLVTLNGKSHLVTRRVADGGGAAAPSNFPIRLILHAGVGGAPTLLQQVYLGQRTPANSSTPISYAGPAEQPVANFVTTPGPTPIGQMGRASTASLPRGGVWPGSGSLGSSASFTVDLPFNDPTNPFVHTYHPDHDNLDDRFEFPLPAGVESYRVIRSITLTFSPTLPGGVSDPGWGVTTLGGTYTETFSGLRSEQIQVSGHFILHQVSDAPTLTN